MNPPPRSMAKLIIGSQYFVYFGVLGVFLPFFNLYCYHIGLNGFQIGVLSAVRSLTLVVFAFLWGELADRLRLRKPLYIGCHLASTAIWYFYLTTTRFEPMFWITLAYGIFFAPLISFLEAFAMDTLGDDRTHYGRLRAWGSTSFILVVLTLGNAIELFSIKIVPVLIFCGGILQTLLATRIPSGAAPGGPSEATGIRGVFNPTVGLFLGCAFLMLVSHGTYYGFFSIYLENLGYGKGFIGVAWALASGAEIVVMINSNRLFSRITIERVLAISFAAAGLRWVLLSLFHASWAILLSQLLHAATYGMFHMAGILYIDRLSPRNSKTTGQAVNNAVTYGLGLMVGFFLSGVLYDRIGASRLFLFSGMLALAGGAVFQTGRKRIERRAG